MKILSLTFCNDTIKVESTKKKPKHNGHYDTPTELGKKWQMDVKHVPTACYAGTDGLDAKLFGVRVISSEG